MRSSLQSSELLLLVFLSTIAHAQSNLQLTSNSPEEFSLGPADHSLAHEIIFLKDYTNTEILLSNSGDAETKCWQHSNSLRHRMHVREDSPSQLICPLNPPNQYSFKQKHEAPSGGQQQLDNSEAGQQSKLDGSNNNKPQPETEGSNGEWWQRIIPDWIHLGWLLPSPQPPSRKTEELYNKGLCSNDDLPTVVSVCAPADPPLCARRQVVIEWCRISTCASSKPTPPQKKK